MINVFGSKKMAIAFFISMGIGISLYSYDIFVEEPVNELSKTLYFYAGSIFFVIPAKYLFINVLVKYVFKRRIKKDEKMFKE